MEKSNASTRRTTARTLPAWWRIAVTDAWLVVFAGVIILSLLPGTNPAMILVSPMWANLAHIPVYVLLTLLTILLVGMRTRVSLAVLMAIVLGVSLFGGLIEVTQKLVGRTASLLDVAWNVTGAVLAALAYSIWRKRRDQRE